MAILLPCRRRIRRENLGVLCNFVNSQPDDVSKLLRALEDGPKTVIALENFIGIRRGRLEALLKILAVEGVVRKAQAGWESTGIEYVHNHAKWSTLTESRNTEANLMRSYAAGKGCLMEFLQVALDDPNPDRAANARSARELRQDRRQKPDSRWIQLAREFSRGIDSTIEIRKRWPSGLPHKKIQFMEFREGRAVATRTTLGGWSRSCICVKADSKKFEKNFFQAQSTS